MSGCDPAVTILVDWLARRRSPVHAIAIPCSSRAALRALVEGQAHVAGVHLRDQKSGEYNLAPIRRALGNQPLDGRELCPLGVGTCDGARQSACDPRFRRPRPAGLANRQSRRWRRSARGSRRCARRGRDQSAIASLAISSRSAAISKSGPRSQRDRLTPESPSGLAPTSYGLNFIPHRDERYDLVFMADGGRLDAGQGDARRACTRGASRAKSASYARYDTAQMGQVVIS